jgi:hypothetical protein
MAWRDREQSLNFVCSGDGGVDDENEKAERIWGKSS